MAKKRKSPRKTERPREVAWHPADRDAGQVRGARLRGHLPRRRSSGRSRTSRCPQICAAGWSRGGRKTINDTSTDGGMLLMHCPDRKSVVEGNGVDGGG